MSRILIIDDDSQLLQLMDVVVIKNGYDVTTAINGRKSLAIIKEHSFEVVITDIVMPEADGLEVLAAISGMSNRPAVIAISGGSQRIASALMLTTAKAMHADMVIPKPVTPRQLLEAVETLLLSRKA